MGIVPIYRPQFLAASNKDIAFEKLMFIKKNGEAFSGNSSLTRDYYDAELICISNEEDNYWIGNYSEGFGFFGVRFNKNDCREATDEEVNEWIKEPENFKF